MPRFSARLVIWNCSPELRTFSSHVTNANARTLGQLFLKRMYENLLCLFETPKPKYCVTEIASRQNYHLLENRCCGLLNFGTYKSLSNCCSSKRCSTSSRRTGAPARLFECVPNTALSNARYFCLSTLRGIAQNKMASTIQSKFRQTLSTPQRFISSNRFFRMAVCGKWQPKSKNYLNHS